MAEEKNSDRLQDRDGGVPKRHREHDRTRVRNKGQSRTALEEKTTVIDRL